MQILKLIRRNSLGKLLKKIIVERKGRYYSNLFSPDCRIVFLGNEKFSIPSLHVILESIDSKDCLSVVVSNGENAVGKLAKAKDLNVILWEDFKAPDRSDAYNIGVVASFGHLIPKRVIERCERGILNVHASVLPKLRGAAPINWAIINGCTETGVTIMNIAPHRFDVGPILLRRMCPIHPDIRAPELSYLLSIIGAESLKEVIGDLDNALLREEKQVEKDATLAPKLDSSIAFVKWDEYSCLQVYNLFRGLYGFHKLYTFYANKKVDLDDIGLVERGPSVETSTEVEQKKSLNERTDFSHFYPSPVRLFIPSDNQIWDNNYVPGQILVHYNSLLIYCADGNFVFSNRIKPGKKWMSANDFQNGYLSKNLSESVFISKDLSSSDNMKGSVVS